MAAPLAGACRHILGLNQEIPHKIMTPDLVSAGK